MRLSNRLRWILAIPASVTFFLVGGKSLDMLRLPDGGPLELAIITLFIITFSVGVLVAPLHGKRFLTTAASLFILTCLIPPWQYTADRNGNSGYHSRTAAGYALLFDPPTNPNITLGHGVQIDFGRLFIEWAALAGITGLVWMLLGKPAWPRDDKADPSQKFPPPTGNPKN
jgi:hypothetical protein